MQICPTLTLEPPPRQRHWNLEARAVLTDPPPLPAPPKEKSQAATTTSRHHIPTTTHLRIPPGHLRTSRSASKQDQPEPTTNGLHHAPSCTARSNTRRTLSPCRSDPRLYPLLPEAVLSESHPQYPHIKAQHGRRRRLQLPPPGGSLGTQGMGFQVPAPNRTR